MINRQRNLLMSSVYYRDLTAEEPLKLKDSDFKLWAAFQNTDFDNDDSEYAKIKLHYYSNGSNLEKKNSTNTKNEIPLVKCRQEMMESP